MVEVKWVVPALRQLEAILEYIALDSTAAAKRIAQRVFEKTGGLGSHPLLGRKIPEFPHRQYRQLWRKPCWVYYRVGPKAVFVLHVRRAETLFRTSDLL